MSKTIILSDIAIQNRIRRIAYQIYEVNSDEKELILAGIAVNGAVLAEKIAGVLKQISPLKIKVCTLTIDKKNPLNSITASLDATEYIHKSVVLVDDVLHSGSTLMYAVRHFLAVPLKQLKTVVLVDRNHKKFPVKVDFKGISLSTSLQDHVEVVFSADKDLAYLE